MCRWRMEAFKNDRISDIAYGDGEIYVKSPQNPVITGDIAACGL